MMKDIYGILKEEGITLLQPPTKGRVYTSTRELDDKFLYCSGCSPGLGNGNTVVGELGRDLTVEEDQKTACNYMLNLLANLSDKIGDLNRVKRFVKVLAFANNVDDFEMQPQVVNRGSNLIAELFGGEVGLPAHSAIGTNTLPGGIACKIEALMELR